MDLVTTALPEPCGGGCLQLRRRRRRRRLGPSPAVGPGLWRRLRHDVTLRASWCRSRHSPINRSSSPKYSSTNLSLIHHSSIRISACVCYSDTAWMCIPMIIFGYLFGEFNMQSVAWKNIFHTLKFENISNFSWFSINTFSIYLSIYLFIYFLYLYYFSVCVCVCIFASSLFFMTFSMYIYFLSMGCKENDYCRIYKKIK